MRKKSRAEAANEAPISPSEINRARIDDEPAPAKLRAAGLRVGARVWFIDTSSRWYELEVVERKPNGRIVFKSATGWDAAREVGWPHGELVEFPTGNKNLRQRLRHISARRP